MTDDYIPFSQRNGYAPIPSQLKLGEVSLELRRLLFYQIHLEIEREQDWLSGAPRFSGSWKKVTQDLHVRFLGQSIQTYVNRSSRVRDELDSFFMRAKIYRLFDIVEFFVRQSACSDELKTGLGNAFVEARSAYRIFDGQIIAIGTEQQAFALENAIASTERAGADAARYHLVAAGKEVRNENWPASVRESIHAVEAMALRLVPDARTLGPALARLEKEGHLHGSLKASFSSLYGYSSDEKGVRHALVFKEGANVDEADALFMLGACASFVSYLIARTF